ncbi:MAG: ribulose-phosphate 3-epimerase [Solirubrobacterales bacterium]|nr:ribulose-phosphate 3-epimerase [Solirubrobacterales bacterium]
MALAGVAPSILSADFARLGAQVAEVMAAGAKVIHVDVMDGHFVPPITMGPMVVDALSQAVHDAGGALDVHLMIERPERQVADFAKAGADSITIHVEATPHVHYALGAIRDAGCRAGLAICPGTPVEAVSGVAAELDLVLCMTVNPGWGGQPFIAGSPARIQRLRALVEPSDRSDPEAEPQCGSAVVEVDGGVDVRTVRRCAEAGATLFVAGSAVFGASDPAEAYVELARVAGVRAAV